MIEDRLHAELAEIALQSAASAKAFGVEPKVAMISYSTGSSGAGADVEKVRAATEYVGEITGRFYHDELLNRIFSRFCIGK